MNTSKRMAAGALALHNVPDASTVSSTSSSAGNSKSSSANKLLREFLASGTSVGCANVFLNPVEVCKTRMMLAARGQAATAAPSTSTAATSTSQPHTFSTQRLVSTSVVRPASAAAALPSYGSFGNAMPNTSGRGINLTTPAAATGTGTGTVTAPPVRRLGMIGTAQHIMASEGPHAFARGVQAAAARAVLNGGIRLGLYNPIKDAISSSSSSSGGSGSSGLGMGAKLAAGMTSGAIGAAATSPLELIKTNQQAGNPQFQRPADVVRHMYGQYGLPGLWRGCSPGVVRVMLLNGFMVATYDEVKTNVTRHTGWSNTGLTANLFASCISGLVTTTAINPVDVVRSYIQTGRGVGSWKVAGQILQQEGPGAFFRGWSAAYARTGPQTVIIFAVAEVVRPWFGLKAIA